jgi:hypothetical protein
MLGKEGFGNEVRPVVQMLKLRNSNRHATPLLRMTCARARVQRLSFRTV